MSNVKRGLSEGLFIDEISIMTFTEEQIKKLNDNPNVISATSRRITYTTEFKKFFVEKYAEGMTPREIFYIAGFDVQALGYKRIERAADRFRQMNNDGKLGKSEFVEVHESRQRSSTSTRYGRQ